MNTRILTLALAASLFGSATSAQTGITIVIRHEPSLMTMTTGSLMSLLNSHERQRTLLAGIDALEGKRLEVHVWSSDTPQPDGVFVGNLTFRLVDGGLDEESNTLVAQRLTDALASELRARLEKAPLDRLERQRDELRAQLDDIARRRRGESASEKIESQRRALTDHADQCQNDLDNAERMAAETDTTRAYLATELAKLQEQLAKAPDATVLKERIVVVSAEIHQITLQVQQIHRQVADRRSQTQDVRKALAALQDRQAELVGEREDRSLLDAAFNRVAQALARVEARIVDFRRFEFEIWR